MSSFRPPVILEEAHFLQIRRELSLFRNDLANLRQNLNHVSVRRHQGGHLPRELAWFSMTEALAEFGEADAYPTVYDTATERWVEDTSRPLETIYSTVAGVTASDNDIVLCRRVPAKRKWEALNASQAGGIPFRNDSGETAPAYGCMRVTGSATVNGTEYVTIAKPSTTFQRIYLVNGGSAVANGGYGIGTWLSDAGWVLYDDASTPAYGESWGPQASSWEIKKWRYGFTIIGNPTGGSTDLVRAKQEEVNEFRGVTDSSHAKDATGTVSIIDGNATDTTDNMADVVNIFADVATTKRVICRWLGGKWYLAAAECD